MKLGYENQTRLSIHELKSPTEIKYYLFKIIMKTIIRIEVLDLSSCMDNLIFIAQFSFLIVSFNIESL